MQNSAPFTFSPPILRELGVTFSGILEELTKRVAAGTPDSTQKKYFRVPGMKIPRKSHTYRVILKKIDTTLGLYFWERVYQVKQL